MTNKALALALGVAAILALPLGDAPQAADQATQVANKRPVKGHYRRDRSLELHSYKGRPVGGYSYKDVDSTSTYGRSPPPWRDVRQSPGGPFDSGFFFDSGVPRGDMSPYPR
jgi:hypothetical protein